jgi:hypothetical protein
MTGGSHTPGPWRSDWQFIVAPDPNGIHPDIYIAEIAGSDEDDRVATAEQQAANACLIAAAPALLDAALRVIDRWSRGDLAEAVRMLDAAVAEAQGGESATPRAEEVARTKAAARSFRTQGRSPPRRRAHRRRQLLGTNSIQLNRSRHEKSATTSHDISRYVPG